MENNFIPLELGEINLDTINNENISISEDYIYSKKAHPFFRILKTLLLLAEIFQNKL